MPKPIEDKTIINIAVPGELLTRIDEYRFDHRFASRSKAIRYLIEQGLEVESDANS